MPQPSSLSPHSGDSCLQQVLNEGQRAHRVLPGLPVSPVTSRHTSLMGLPTPGSLCQASGLEFGLESGDGARSETVQCSQAETSVAPRSLEVDVVRLSPLSP